MSSVSNNPAISGPTVRPTLARNLTVAAAPAVQTSAAGDRLALSARPIAPTRVSTAATGAEQPTFNNPEDYKNWVSARITALVAALSVQAQDKSERDATAKAQADTDAAAGKNMRAIENEVQNTRSQYQAPIDSISRDLQNAQAALEAVLHPGRQRGQELASQAGQVQQQIEGATRQIQSTQANINNMRAEENQARQQIAEASAARVALENEMGQLQAEVGGGQIGAAGIALNDDAASVRTAQGQLDQAMNRLNQA